MRKQQTKKNGFISFLLAICAWMVLCVPVWAAEDFAASDTCRNLVNEGITYHLAKNLSQSESDKWRYPFKVTDETGTDLPEGTVKSVWVKIASDTTTYQCTEKTTDGNYAFSCNSLPQGAYITDIYFSYSQEVPVTGGSFKVVFKEADTAEEDVIMTAAGKLVSPQYPCARGQEVQAWTENTTGSLIVNPDCSDTEKQKAEFKDGTFAIVNQAYGTTALNDALTPERFKLAVSPADPDYGYTITLYFDYYDENGAKIGCSPENRNSCKTLSFEHKNTTNESQPILDGKGDLDGKTSEMPYTLVFGEISDLEPDDPKTNVSYNLDVNGIAVFPNRTNFNFKLYYENEYGTQGYQNSDFHFERNLNLTFGNVCPTPTDPATGQIAADGVIDPCQKDWQLFNADFTGLGDDPDDPNFPYPFKNQYVYSANLDKDAACAPGDDCTAPKKEPAHHSNYFFGLSKCADSKCSTVYNTDGYVYSVTVMDGKNQSKTYKVAGFDDSNQKKVSRFSMKVYQGEGTIDKAERPFAVKKLSLNVKEPGTYRVYCFIRDWKDWTKSKTAKDKADALYYVDVTIPDTSSIKNCITEGTNGYYVSKWNDCLDPHKTQLMTMVPETETSRAYIDNKSKKGVTFYFDSATSYLPSYVELDTIKCKFSPLVKDGSVAGGYCNKKEIYVPPYTRVRVESATFYMDDIPDETIDRYSFSYIRPDTRNQIHLFTNIDVAPCENVKKIPDTGFSLRSPMRAKVQEATSFVFTGNSIQIPAIGLGMEYPIPIVHVYYENGETNERGWDLSTLGNYVGELEGGQYLPNKGNSALTGHNWSGGVFKNVGNLHLEDEIYIYGYDGFKYTYRVTENFITDPGDVYAMFQQIGESSITLVTCENYNIVTDEYERRQLVRATLTNVEAYEM